MDAAVAAAERAFPAWRATPVVERARVTLENGKTLDEARGEVRRDLHATGRDTVEFYTEKRVVTSRWGAA